MEYNTLWSGLSAQDDSGTMSLFDHIGFESRNVPVAYQFYSGCMALLDLRVLKTAEDVFFISGHSRSPLPFLRVTAAQEATAVHKPDGKEPAFQPGNHLHLKFTAQNQEQVDEFYRTALGVGGRDSGAPSYQGPQELGYYAALVFDPDGNTIEVGVHTQRD